MIRQCECGDLIMFARVGNSRVPIDAITQAEVAPGLVVFNAETEGGQVLTGQLVANGKAARWVEMGATLHKPHWAQCPHADKFRRKGQ